MEAIGAHAVEEAKVRYFSATLSMQSRHISLANVIPVREKDTSVLEPTEIVKSVAPKL